ncbi:MULTISPECIES: hypothetical protein [Burkholderia cepacia complex]|uniref:hypothetical protein n=1 Tax=Burkholderia cepacia complex TaxID=87882 RepID=UPI001FB69E00|nr:MULTISPECIES: hypothetical protein [Burkholderia cepacia complex]
MNDQQQSRADALTDRIKAMFVPNPSDELGPTDEPESQYRFGYNTAIEDVLSVLAESPSSQPAAAPIAYDGLTEEFTDEVARLAGDAPGIREAVWAALENCNAIIAPQGNAAPSPADERAVCTHQWTWADGKCADCGARTQQPTPTGGMTLGERIAHVGGRVTDGGTVEFGSAMALDALVQHVLRDTRAAASPAAEAVAWVRKHPDTGALSGDWLWNDAIEQCRKDSGVWFPLGFLAAPQPAQADARVGLTDEQRKALQRAIDHAVMSDREDEEEALRALLAAHPGQPEPRTEVTDTEPQWIVNDLGELGVKVGGRFFFLYKGDNIEYGANSSSDGIALHDDGSPMQYRIVGKREFGETCLPVKWILQGRSEDRYHEKLVYHPRLSFGKPEDGDWKLLPAARAQGGES